MQSTYHNRSERKRPWTVSRRHWPEGEQRCLRTERRSHSLESATDHL